MQSDKLSRSAKIAPVMMSALVHHFTDKQISGVWASSVGADNRLVGTSTTFEFQSNYTVTSDVRFRAGKDFSDIHAEGIYEYRGNDIIAKLKCKSSDGELFKGIRNVGDVWNEHLRLEPNGDIIVIVQEGEPGMRLKPIVAR